jgi:hypothetical protein
MSVTENDDDGRARTSSVDDSCTSDHEARTLALLDAVECKLTVIALCDALDERVRIDDETRVEDEKCNENARD